MSRLTQNPHWKFIAALTLFDIKHFIANSNSDSGFMRYKTIAPGCIYTYSKNEKLNFLL